MLDFRISGPLEVVEGDMPVAISGRNQRLGEGPEPWQGPALADSELETFALGEAQRLEELGIEPGRALQQLYAQILRQERILETAPRPPRRRRSSSSAGTRSRTASGRHSTA